MGKHVQRVHSSEHGGGGVRITYKGLGAAGTALGILLALFTLGGKLATKSDIDGLKSAVTPTLNQHEARIRDLELQNAAHFGASPAGTRPSADAPPSAEARFILAQMQMQQQIPAASQVQRPVVVPLELIQQYRLPPTSGGTYALLGEDGRYYSLDLVLAVIIRMHLEEMRRK
jgi:hypothetical protein